MAKVDKHFAGFHSSYDFKDKIQNIDHQKQYLFSRTSNMFHYEGLPLEIPVKMMELLIQSRGYGIFLEIDGKFYVVNGGLGGELDAYGRATKAIVSIPFLNYSKTLEIDKDCVIIPNDTMMTGLNPLFNRYVYLLNENNISITLSVINSRLQTIISANDDRTVESAQEFLKRIIAGEIGVIAEQQLFESLKVNNKSVKGESVQELIELEQYLKASMYNEIGLSANFNMKKERLINAEVELNNDILYPFIDDMKDSREKALEKIKELYNLDISVSFKSSWSYKDRVNEVAENLETDVIDEVLNETEQETIHEIVKETEHETLNEKESETENEKILKEGEDERLIKYENAGEGNTETSERDKESDNGSEKEIKENEENEQEKEGDSESEEDEKKKVKK